MTVVKALIVAHEPVGTVMTGPAIRCWELAKTLSGLFDVTLAVPAPSDLPASGFRLATYQYGSPDSLVSLARRADAIVLSGYLLAVFPVLSQIGHPLIVDVYDPFPIESLSLQRRQATYERVAISKGDFRVLRQLLQAGDFFLCGSEQQRTFWLGMLAANGRLNPLTHEADPSFRSLVDVVPMGIPSQPPVACGSLKGSFPGIEVGDFLLVWPGGLWEWLDPLTAVEAVHLLAGEAPEVKLLFPGIRHPHPERIGVMETPDAVLARARELGLLGSRVFCCDWTPYGERARYLLDADVALSLHFDGLESGLAIRARLLDCVWSGTPVISTRGDVIAEALAGRGLAKLVPPRDPTAVAEAILSWRSGRGSQSRLAEGFRDMVEQYRWSAVSRPLVEFLRAPHRAADHGIRSSPTGGAETTISSTTWESAGAPLGTSDFRNPPPGSPANDVEWALAEAIERIRLQDADIAQLRDLLRRISSGKVMRTMNAFHSIMARIMRRRPGKTVAQSGGPHHGA